MANYSKTFVHTGLGAVDSTKVPDSGIYAVEGKISLPMSSTGAGKSEVVVVVSKNSTPVYTGSAGRAGFYIAVSCAANDVIDVSLSSSATVDQSKNVIKSNITISLGSTYAIA